LNAKLHAAHIVQIHPMNMPDNGNVKIPCTEMRHCYRKDIQVVLIIMNSLYKIIGEKEKEYVVMANSSHGWRFGGGTFLNIPFGETMTILDRKDERRYEYKGIDTRL